MTGIASIEWTEERRARVRALHEEGLSYAAIAERLSVEFDRRISKNMIVGQAHQMKLPQRDTAAPAKKLLAWLQERAALGQGAPTNDEICNLVGQASVSCAPRLLYALQRAGHIKLTYLSRNSRTIAAADGSWVLAGTPPAAPSKPHVRAEIVPERRPPHPAITLTAAPASDDIADDAAMDRIASLRAQIAAATVRAVGTRHRTCQFPVTKDRPHLLCGDPVVRAGKPYCGRHHLVCYVPREPRG